MLKRDWVVTGFRCIDCNEELNKYEREYIDIFEQMCEHCFDMQQKAYKDILPDDYYYEELDNEL